MRLFLKSEPTSYQRNLLEAVGLQWALGSFSEAISSSINLPFIYITKETDFGSLDYWIELCEEHRKLLAHVENFKIEYIIGPSQNAFMQLCPTRIQETKTIDPAFIFVEISERTSPLLRFQFNVID